MIREKISIRIISPSILKSILELWNNEFELKSDKVVAISDKNIFHSYLIRNKASAPIRSILSYLCERHSAFGLVEEPYMDSTFWDDHCNFYNASFSKYPIHCRRFHFFSGDEKKADDLIRLLENGGTTNDLKNLDLEYLGYCIFRPTPSFVVGRTAILFDTRDGRTLNKMGVPVIEEEFDSTPYMKVFQKQVIRLLNGSLDITTPEFIQQDPNLGHCATASLWVTNRAMSKLIGTAKFQYGTITRQAIGGWNREHDVQVTYDPTDVDSGLSISEMRNAIAATGANSFPLTPSFDESGPVAFGRICHEIYSFLESGMPVLLLLESEETRQGHVVVAVGHGLPHEVDLSDCLPACEIVGLQRNPQESGVHYTIGNLVKLYYAHDDAYGPFNRVLFNQGRNNENKDEPPQILVNLGRNKTPHFLRHALAPVPRQVRSPATPALIELIQYFNKATIYGEHIFTPPGGAIVWRSLLARPGAFKHSLLSRGYSEDLMKWYANLHLPKYIWLYEATFVENAHINKWRPNKTNRKILGEFIFDATCSSYDVPLLSERVKGFFRDANMKQGIYNLDKKAGYYNLYVPKNFYIDEDEE